MANIKFTNNLFNTKKGFAAILATIIVLGVVMTVVAALSLSSLRGQKINRNFIRSAEAFYAAESGIEDSLYRIIKGKNFQATNNLAVGSSTAAINISGSGSSKTILVDGEASNRFRSLEVKLTTNTDDVSFYYGVQVGEGGLTMSNNAKVWGSIYSNGSVQGGSGAVLTGDAFVAGSAASLDQQSTVVGSDFIFGKQVNEIDAGQSFIPSVSEKLTKLSLYLKKFGNPGNKTVRVLTDNGGSPSKTLAGAGSYGTLIASQISQNNYGWIDVPLGTPPNLTAGTKYWIVVDTSADNNDYFFWGKDSTDSYAVGTGKYSPSWNASSPAWYSAGGDLAFKAWLGGVTNFIDSMQVGGNVHSNTISNSAITGDAYYQTISNSTVGGIQYPGSPDPAMESMPISESNIADWKTDAEAGGVIYGDYYLVNYATASLGLKKIVGNMVISNGAQLTITGTIYVTGTINISNNAIINLGSNYGINSGVVLADGLISVSNNVVFNTLTPGSYILFLSAKSGDAITVANNANTVIFYASVGNVTIANNAKLKEVTAYKITLANNAEIFYETGLASAKFSSGSGASWEIDSWQEVP